ESMRRIYPGIWDLVERMVPTYARHAGRRAVEMRELEQTARSAGIESGLISAVRLLHEDLSRQVYPPAAQQDVTTFIQHLRDGGTPAARRIATHTEATTS